MPQLIIVALPGAAPFADALDRLPGARLTAIGAPASC